MLKILKRFRELKFSDYMAIFTLLIAFVLSIFYRKKNKNLILISEAGSEARDNGYWLFKYICENEKNVHVAYVIDKKSVDYSKVKDLGEVIQFKSLKHWIYYLSAGVNVSSQKGGKPNPAIFYLLEVVLKILRNKRVFLQHGITKDDADWLYYKNTTFRLFVCGAKPEYDYIKVRYGYPDKNVEYLGFSRFDQLHDIDVDNKRILVMPTWREWLVSKTDAHYKFKESSDFSKTEYYKYWSRFLNNKKLLDYIKENELELIFYPHRNVQPYIDLFRNNQENVIFADWRDYDIQALLKTSAFMITDYSSVFMDFAYMHKPMLFYQFDYDKFREGQYQEGYFNYENNGFGPVFYEDSEAMVDYIINMHKSSFNLEDKYLERINGFFPLYDKNNSKRIYESIVRILSE